MDDLEKKTLMLKLNYEFKNESLLVQAVTHRSAGDENNERLEFLGDAVLNFIVAYVLYAHFPEAREGQLSRLRATLVKRESLAELARDKELGRHLILGPGELKSGGASRSSILADAMEAVIGAIYLDSDMPTCEELILQWYGDQISELSLNESHKDAKTELQEFLQARRQPLPRYELQKVKGREHAQIFQVLCTCALLPDGAMGEGSSRRKSEQDAASHVLEALKGE